MDENNEAVICQAYVKKCVQFLDTDFSQFFTIMDTSFDLLLITFCTDVDEQIYVFYVDRFQTIVMRILTT